MANPFESVTPGQALEINATAYNLLLQQARERAGKQRGPNGNKVTDGFPTPARVLVHNTTASTLPQWAIVSVGAPTWTPSYTGEIYQRRTAYAATAPTAGGLFAVCQEAIPAGAIGFAVVAGVTPCLLNVAASGDTHADATTSVTELTTGTGGRAEIISKASGTGAGKIGIVCIGPKSLAEAEVIEIDHIAKACVTKSSGVVTNITFEHRKIRVLGVLLPDETYCTDGDDDCCPPSVQCCPGIEMPQTLCATINVTSGCSFLTGTKALLEYSGVSDWPAPYPSHTWAGSITMNNCGDFQSNMLIWLHCPIEFYPTDNWFITLLWTGCSVADNCLDLSWLDGVPTNYSVESSSCEPLEIISPEITARTPNCPECVFTLSISEDVEGCSDLPTVDTCCDDTGTLAILVNGTGDFDEYAALTGMTYNPSAIVSLLGASSCPEISRFQWYAHMTGWPGDPYLFFGCVDGVYCFGFAPPGSDTAPFDKADCFAGFTDVAADPGCGSHAFRYKAVDSFSCEGTEFATIDLTGDGESGCSGTINITIYR